MFKLTSHACRRCRGRILHDGDTLYRCAECGATAEGDIERLCHCGLTVEDGRDARFRCRVIPPSERTAAVPFEIGVVKV